MTQSYLFDDGPFPISTDDLLEKDIQSKCVEHARRSNAYARKFSSPANRSVPDYLFVWEGLIWFVEFKRKGKTPTEQQADEHVKIRAAGGKVWVIDDIEDFKKRFVRVQMRMVVE